MPLLDNNSIVGIAIFKLLSYTLLIIKSLQSIILTFEFTIKVVIISELTLRIGNSTNLYTNLFDI